MATTTAEVRESAAPSRFRFSLWHVSLLLVFLGLFFSGYLSYVKIANVQMVCIEGGMFNCSVVESSAWSKFMGIPVAYLGFLAHLTLGAILLLSRRVQFFADNGVMLIFAFALFGVMYHSYLVYVSVFVLKALCPWCLAAATTMLLQLIVTSVRLRRVLAA